MRPNNLTTTTAIGSNQGEIKLGLDQNAVAHLIGVLTDLYSDPIKAVVREYSTNARDSHIDAGVTRPIEVTLPSAIDPTFKVQDFGLGLNVDDLTNVYSLYGNSTKRESDLVNGVLGLGCKSALTYALSFTVTAVKGGVKTLAVIAKGEDGVGTIKILDTVATDESNGVTVAVPVRERDIQRFQGTVATLFRFWDKGTVLVNGEEPDNIRDETGWLWLDTDVAIRTGDDGSYVVQNNVAYPVERQNFSVEDGFDVVAFVPAGTVNFTPSREALHYTGLTKDTLKTLSQYVAERLPQAIEEHIDGGSSTPWDRLQLINQYRRFAPKLARRLAAQYGDGPSIPAGREVITYNANAYRHKSRRQGSISWWNLFDHHTRTTIVIDYPLKSLSPVNRERLDISQHVSADVILLPDGTDLSGLIGRGNVVAWDVILEETKEEPRVKVKAERKQRAKTLYRIHRDGRWHEEASVEGTKPVVYAVKAAQDRWDWRADQRHLDEHHFVRDEVELVELRERQVPKFLRENEDAVSLAAYVTAKRAEALRWLTTDDIVKNTVDDRINSVDFFLYLADHIAEIQDDELGLLLLILQTPRSAKLVAADKLGVSPAQDDETIGLITTLFARYPLAVRSIGTDTVEDAVLYINAKYQTL